MGRPIDPISPKEEVPEAPEALPPLPRMYTAHEILAADDAPADADAASAASADGDEEEEGTMTSSFVPVRSKWVLDGSETIDQMVGRLLDSIEYYRGMKREGWELAGRIFDDCGYLVRA